MAATSVPGGAAPVSQADPSDRRRWLILGLIGLAQLMIVLDVTIMNIALPSAQHALHFSNVDRQWIITAYALAFGSLLLFGGRLGDLFGRKVTFLIGLIGFAAPPPWAARRSTSPCWSRPGPARERSPLCSLPQRCPC